MPSEYRPINPPEFYEKEFACKMCDKPIDKEGFCSWSCFEADMI